MNGTVKPSIQCLVVVKDYESSGDRGLFVQDFQVVPSVGDIVLLEPGGDWGRIWYVVERRIIYNDSVTLCTRRATDDDRNKMLQYGEVLEG